MVVQHFQANHRKDIMQRRDESLIALVLATLLLTSCAQQAPVGKGRNEPAAAGGSGGQQDGDSLRVAVLTGGHAFDVPNFYQLFRELSGVDAYPQHIEHFASSPEDVRDSYDVILFYGMDQNVPYEEGRRAGGNAKAAIERLADQGQGIVVLHHALLAWEKWDFWNQLIGFDNRNFRYKEGLDLQVRVTDDSHPGASGLEDFEVVDEGYVLHGEYDGQGNVLMTVDHEDAMEQVAWAREQGNSRVFCLTLGHDNEAWTNPAFRRVLSQAITWTAD
jgi:type 1 glutamine amidotransferase